MDTSVKLYVSRHCNASGCGVQRQNGMLLPLGRIAAAVQPTLREYLLAGTLRIQLGRGLFALGCTQECKPLLGSARSLDRVRTHYRL